MTQSTNKKHLPSQTTISITKLHPTQQPVSHSNPRLNRFSFFALVVCLAFVIDLYESRIHSLCNRSFDACHRHLSLSMYAYLNVISVIMRSFVRYLSLTSVAICACSLLIERAYSSLKSFIRLFNAHMVTY